MRNPLLAVFIFLLLQSACITKNTLIKQSLKNNKETRSSVQLSGEYQNAIDTNKVTTQTLWHALYNCANFNEYRNKISANATIRLQLIDNNKLHVSLLQDNLVMDELDVAVKQKGKYWFVKRHLSLIPLPFIYYKHVEARLCFYQTNAQSIQSCFMSENSLWILIMAAGNSSRLNQQFIKIK
jgi:hypothetical protein